MCAAPGVCATPPADDEQAHRQRQDQGVPPERAQEGQRGGLCDGERTARNGGRAAHPGRPNEMQCCISVVPTPQVKKEKLPVGPVVLAFFLFVVVGSGEQSCTRTTRIIQRQATGVRACTRQLWAPRSRAHDGCSRVLPHVPTCAFLLLLLPVRSAAANHQDGDLPAARLSGRSGEVPVLTRERPGNDVWEDELLTPF